MRKIFAFLAMLCLPLLFSVPAFAAETTVSITPDAGGGEVTVVDWGGAQSGAAPVASDTGAAGGAVPVRDAAEQFPQSVEEFTENGAAIIRKTYELAPGADPQTLVRNFERDGYSFVCREILRRELPGEALIRQASKTALTETEGDGAAEIMPHFPDSINFEDGGYSGRLYLDASTFKTEAAGYESYTYSTVRTREVPGLDRNDPSYLDKEWDGMALSGVSFKQGPDGSYTATASYRGTAAGRRETGYVTAAVYHGEISMTAPGNILYTVVYEAAPMLAAEAPITAEQEEAPATPGATGEGAAPAEAAASPEPPALPAGETPPAKGGMTACVVAGLAGILLGAAGVRLLPRLRAKFHTRKDDDIET